MCVKAFLRLVFQRKAKDKKGNPLNLTVVLQKGEPNEYELHVEIFKILNDHYRNDINAVWQRSQFFTAILSAVFAAYSFSLKPQNYNLKPIIENIGLVLSISWFLLAYVSMCWLNVWREQVVNFEKKIYKKGPFTIGEGIKGNKFHQKVRPEVVSVFVASLAVLLWVLLRFDILDIHQSLKGCESGNIVWDDQIF